MSEKFNYINLMMKKMNAFLLFIHRKVSSKKFIQMKMIDKSFFPNELYVIK